MAEWELSLINSQTPRLVSFGFYSFRLFASQFLTLLSLFVFIPISLYICFFINIFAIFLLLYTPLHLQLVSFYLSLFYLLSSYRHLFPASIKLGFVSYCDQSLQFSYSLLFTPGFFHFSPNPHYLSIFHSTFFHCLIALNHFFLFLPSLVGIFFWVFSSCRLSLYFQFFAPTGEKKTLSWLFFCNSNSHSLTLLFYFISFRISFLFILFSLFISNEIRTYGESDRDREW